MVFTCPKIVLDGNTSEITLANDPAGKNAITIGMTETAIKQAAGTVSISTGEAPAESKLVLDSVTGATLASPMGAVAINGMTGDTTITTAGVIVGSFSATTGVNLISGASSIQITDVGLMYKGTVIQLG